MPSLLDLGGGAILPYFCNLPLEGDHPSITRAVIVVHGLHRNAQGAFQAVMDSASYAGEAHRTIVFAPWFQETSPAPGQLYWSNDRWRDGRVSNAQSGIPSLSSYTVIDLILKQLTDPGRFADLTDMVLAGHSAGGQLMQRYGATNLIQPALKRQRFRYIVANPGTYMYLNRRRWIRGRFRTPGWIRRLLCPTWNTYRFGLRKRNGYVAQPSAEQIRSQYPERRVIYLLGDKDVGNADLDRSCPARLQGSHRFQRGKTYFRHIEEFFTPHAHALITVPGVGHSGGDMYRSAAGQSALFQP